MQRVQGHDMVSLLLDLDWNAKSSLEFTKENHKNRFSPPGLPSVFEKNQLQIELPGIYILAATMIQAVCFVSHLWLLCFLQEKRVVSVGNFRIEIQWLHPFSSPAPPPPRLNPSLLVWMVQRILFICTLFSFIGIKTQALLNFVVPYLNVMGQTQTNFAWAGLGLSTSCSKFLKKFPVISQKVAYKCSKKVQSCFLWRSKLLKIC